MSAAQAGRSVRGRRVAAAAARHRMGLAAPQPARSVAYCGSAVAVACPSADAGLDWLAKALLGCLVDAHRDCSGPAGGCAKATVAAQVEPMLPPRRVAGSLTLPRAQEVEVGPSRAAAPEAAVAPSVLAV